MNIKRITAGVLRVIAPWTIQVAGVAGGLIVVLVGKLTSHRAHFTLAGSLLAFFGLILPLMFPPLSRFLTDRLSEDADVLNYLASRDAYPMMLDDIPLSEEKETK